MIKTIHFNYYIGKPLSFTFFKNHKRNKVNNYIDKNLATMKIQSKLAINHERSNLSFFVNRKSRNYKTIFCLQRSLSLYVFKLNCIPWLKWKIILKQFEFDKLPFINIRFYKARTCKYGLKVTKLRRYFYHYKRLSINDVMQFLIFLIPPLPSQAF